MRAFHNKGWEYYDLFCEIYPEGSATGRYAYHGTIGATVATVASSSTTSQIKGQLGNTASPDQSSLGAIYHPSVDSQQGIPTLALFHLLVFLTSPSPRQCHLLPPGQATNARTLYCPKINQSLHPLNFLQAPFP